MADLYATVASTCSRVTTQERLELLQITSETENTFRFERTSLLICLSWAFTLQLLVLDTLPFPLLICLTSLLWRD